MRDAALSLLPNRAFVQSVLYSRTFRYVVVKKEGNTRLRRHVARTMRELFVFHDEGAIKRAADREISPEFGNAI
jgi:hypothetical protein